MYSSSEAGSGTNQDRFAYFKHEPYEILVVADGAGGQGGGGIAAESSIEFLREACGKHALSPENCSQLLRDLDSWLCPTIAAGECTAVILVCHGDLIFGASVGDSEAWLIDTGQVTVLTDDQYRKPLLGSGAAIPVEFGPVPFVGTLLIGSDGLFNYVRRNRIIECVRRTAQTKLAARLLCEARLPVGGFQDDITVAVCRRRKEKPNISSPLDSSLMPHQERRSIHFPSPTISGQRPKLLLVENHGVFAETIAREFLSEYDVLCVPTVFEAINMLVRESYAALLVDYDLDDGKGVEVIAAANKLAARPVIIASSAHDFGNEALMKAGASATCKKSHFHKIGAVLNTSLKQSCAKSGP